MANIESSALASSAVGVYRWRGCVRCAGCGAWQRGTQRAPGNARGPQNGWAPFCCLSTKARLHQTAALVWPCAVHL